MSQEVLNCYKYIKSKPSTRVSSLLFSTSFSVFWMMVFSSSAIAQVNSSLTNIRVTTAPLTNQSENGLRSSNKDKIQDLENSFIQQTVIPGVSTGKKIPSNGKSELKSQNRDRLSHSGKLLQNLPTLTAQDTSQFDLKLTRQVKDPQSCNIRTNCQQINQSSIQVPAANFDGQLRAQVLSQESVNTQKVQEFIAPGVSNSRLNPQPYIAPLPPLPGTQTQPRQQSSLNSQPTFNQLLYSPKNQPSASVNPTLSNNPLLGSPTSQPTVTTNSLPGFNQVSGSQTSILPALPVTQGARVQPSIQPSVVPMVSSSPSVVTQPVEERQASPFASAVKRKTVKEPSLTLQGVYVNQGGDSSARARVTGIYPLTPQALFGATLDLTSEDSSFDDSRGEGLNINELYFATSLGGLPNLRFVVGQMDLTSYFDRNSFAKDGASHFFNPVFQTNPALSSTGIGSRPGFLVNWNVTDNVAAKAAIFSSSDAMSEFSLDGFAGEIGVRYGNAIIRGTYSTARDGGNRDSFPESFEIARGNNQFGPLEDDREEAYGLNAEVFIPNMKLGLFGRYGRYENRDLGEGAETYSLGLSFLDLLTPDDRLGLAYGRGLSNDALRRGEQPDVVELFYDFKFLSNLRLGFSFQGRDSFEESVLGIRVKSEFDITPKRRGAR